MVNREIVDRGLQGLENTKTENLVSYLFHEAGGTFTITNAPNNPMRYVQPGHIGRMLKIVKVFVRAWHELLHGDSSRAKGAKGQAEQKPLVVAFLRDSGLSDDQNKAFNKFIGNKKQFLEEKFREAIKNYLVSLRLSKPLKGGATKEFAASDYKEFIAALLGALQESDWNNSQALYPPHTPQGLLLGFMLKKAHTKRDLQAYLEGYTGQRVGASEAGGGAASEAAQPVTLDTSEYSRVEIEALSAQVPDLGDVSAFGSFLACYLYKRKYAGPLPKLVEQGNVVYDGLNFVDCVDTMVRNVCNIMTYKQWIGLGQPVVAVRMSGELEAFYRQGLNSDPSEVSNIQVHQDWLPLVENKVGVAYNRLKVRGGRDQIEIVTVVNNMIGSPGPYAEYEGFVPWQSIDSVWPTKEVRIGQNNYNLHELTVGSKKYLMVPAESELLCYEVMPTLSNVVVIMNDLFSLNLYQNLLDVFDPERCTQYFFKMCKRFDWAVKDRDAFSQQDDSSSTRSDSVSSLDEDSALRAGGGAAAGPLVRSDSTSSLDKEPDNNDALYNQVKSFVQGESNYLDLTVCRGDVCFEFILVHKVHGRIESVDDNQESPIKVDDLSYAQHPVQVALLLPLFPTSTTLDQVLHLMHNNLAYIHQGLMYVGLGEQDLIKELAEKYKNAPELKNFFYKIILELRNTVEDKEVFQIFKNIPYLKPALSLKLEFQRIFIKNDPHFEGNIWHYYHAYEHEPSTTGFDTLIQELRRILEGGVSSEYGKIEALNVIKAMIEAGMITRENALLINTLLSIAKQTCADYCAHQIDEVEQLLQDRNLLV